MKYETPESTTESEGTETSEDEQQAGGKKRKLELPKKKKMMLKKQQNVMSISNQIENDDVAMVEKHLEALEARNSISMPSFTFPQEIFDEADDI